jgi:hypothetical protein
MGMGKDAHFEEKCRSATINGMKGRKGLVVSAWLTTT